MASQDASVNMLRRVPRGVAGMEIPYPSNEPAYVDPMNYRAVHFYGPRLHIPLRAAADYLESLEAKRGMPPHVVCSNEAFSDEDASGALAWKVTLVINDDIG
jgi:hypothetical protein